MINRFNFYDLYGYVVPGLSLVALLWLPYALVPSGAKFPDLTLALGLLILSYVIGHLIQILAAKFLPSTFQNSKGVFRYPSEILLEDANAPAILQLPPHMKERVIKKIEEWFGEGASGTREQAFFLSRSALIQRGKGGYAEQMQGMYTLMRGLTAVFILASGYYFGWCLSAVGTEERVLGIMGALIVGLPIGGALLYRERKCSEVIREQIGYLLLPLALITVAGIFLGGKIQAGHVGRVPFGCIAGLCLLLAGVTFGSFRKFAVEFATAVYRDFLVLEKRQDEEQKDRESGEPEA